MNMNPVFVKEPGRMDIEAGKYGGGGQLYPGMMESPQMRWGFIRKVYAILCIQLLITSVVATVMYFTPAVKQFMATPIGGLTMIVFIIFTFILCIMMGFFSRSHPWNYVLMLLFTLCMACMVGVACAFREGPTILFAAGLTVLITVSLTLYTFWASKRGQDFDFLGPFLLCAVIVLVFFGLIRMIVPLGATGHLVYSCLAALIFSAFIIYDTHNLIKNFDYDDYIPAAICLYGDIVNLFLAILGMTDD